MARGLKPAKEDVEYLADHNIHELVNSMMEELLRHKPSDPRAHLRDMLNTEPDKPVLFQPRPPQGSPPLTTLPLVTSPRAASPGFRPLPLGLGDSHGSFRQLTSRTVVEEEREVCVANMRVFDTLLEAMFKSRPDANRKFWSKLRAVLKKVGSPVGDKVPKPSHAEDYVPIPPEVAAEMLSILKMTALMTMLSLNPKELAAAFEEDYKSVLGELLYATKHRIVSMQWSPMCTNCGGPTSSTEHLSQVPEVATCPACTQRDSVNGLSMLKVFFAFNNDIFYAPNCGTSRCLLSEGTKQKIVGSYLIPFTKEGGYLVEFDLEPGRYTMFCTLSRFHRELEVMGPASETQPRVVLELQASGTENLEAERGNVVFKVHNDLQSIFALQIFRHFDRLTELAVSCTEAHPNYLSAQEVLHDPVFCKLFNDQTVSLSRGLTTEGVVIAFTDITNSTLQYDQMGDGLALRMVQDHFQIMFASVAKHNGRVIKTVGDAVMCSYYNPGAALASMVEATVMCTRYSQSDECPPGGSVQLKIGIHVGQSMLVCLNGINDYFGQAVNIAARVQGLASANSIVISEMAWQDTLMQKQHTAMQERGLTVEIEERNASLKGVSEVMKTFALTFPVDPAGVEDSVFDPELHTQQQEYFFSPLMGMHKDDWVFGGF
eukprot:Hpha_TRINITY_DN15423_c6_g1::TRINITY_DN15423_c6_g1_i1::g.174655::m.174655